MKLKKLKMSCKAYYLDPKENYTLFDATVHGVEFTLTKKLLKKWCPRAQK